MDYFGRECVPEVYYPLCDEVFAYVKPCVGFFECIKVDVHGYMDGLSA